MKIIEAVKSGKRFRRKINYENMGWLSFRTNNYIAGLCREDILADDWEIEGEKIALSWDEIENAIHGWTGWVHTTERAPIVNYKSIKKLLGFKE